MYTESSEGAHTADQALRVRKLYEMYMCDYIVIDVKVIPSWVKNKNWIVSEVSGDRAIIDKSEDARTLSAARSTPSI